MRHFLATLAAILLTTAFAAEQALAKAVSLSQGAAICAKYAGGQNSCGVGGKSKCCFYCVAGHCVDVTCNSNDCWVEVFRRAPSGSPTGVVGTQPSAQGTSMCCPPWLRWSAFLFTGTR
jgi:hypothetical protein